MRQRKFLKNMLKEDLKLKQRQLIINIFDMQ